MSDLDSNARENLRITLGLLEAVEAGNVRTQRGLAADLGIALGLVNVYLKRCVKKGLVKVSEAPARRYAYYLTPQGFAEKSRLTGEYLSWSLTFFRRAKTSCSDVLAEAKRRGWQRIAVMGAGDLADIVRICASDTGLEIVAIVDATAAPSAVSSPAEPSRIGFVASLDLVADRVDGVIVTDLKDGAATFAAAVARLGRQRVLAPAVVPILPLTTEGSPD